MRTEEWYRTGRSPTNIPTNIRTCDGAIVSIDSAENWNNNWRLIRDWSKTLKWKIYGEDFIQWSNAVERSRISFKFETESTLWPIFCPVHGSVKKHLFDAPIVSIVLARNWNINSSPLRAWSHILKTKIYGEDLIHWKMLCAGLEDHGKF
jgi:hypothetical protein